jgi:3-methyladenine DNA glycosylase AlkC
MPEPLKNIFTKNFFDGLSFAFEEAIPLYNHKDFLKRIFCKEWKDMELKQRVRHAARCLHPFLPANFPKAAPQLVKASVLLRGRHRKEYGYFCIFLCDYIEEFGLDHFEVSMKAIEKLTQLASAEFCIRQFIIKYPEKTMSQLLTWSNHASPDVRRLSSEGCRPRLPWAISLPRFKKDPAVILPILENLKADSSEYVRRSVANNLNDIAKDHPQLVLDIVAKWKGVHPFTDQIIKHGCRTLLKRGNTDALHHLGFQSSCRVKTQGLLLSKKKIRIGDKINFSFNFSLLEKSSHKLRLEYGIDYVKSNGKSNRKIFKITEGEFNPNIIYTIERNQSFKELTTRKHYPGEHKITIIVNGQACCSESFYLS